MRGASMLTLIAGFLFIGGGIWLLSTYNEVPTNNITAEINHLKTTQARMALKADVDASFSDLTSMVNRIETEEIPRLTDGIHGSNTCVEEIFKRLTALENEQKSIERRLATHEVVITARKPLPIELVPELPTTSKKKRGNK